jgi:DNA-binding NtrC family response regulator
VRILAATNKNLLELVNKGKFREDLFYRLNVIEIALPALQDRGDDTILLARHFAKKFSKEMGKAEPQFTDKALEILRNYAWPGNVRELENVIRRLVVMADSDRIDAPDLPSLMRFSGQRDRGLNRTLATVEAEHIRNVLTSVNGNKSKAAEILGIDRKTLREKLKRLNSESS